MTYNYLFIALTQTQLLANECITLAGSQQKFYRTPGLAYEAK